MNLDAKLSWELFIAALVGFALWEMACPWRPVSTRLVRRWINHGVLLLGSSALLMLVLRVGSVAIALDNSRFGLFNLLPIPRFGCVVLAILLLDLLRYGVHRAFHASAVLWRVHQVHHSDADIDLSTGVRHHPLESLVSQGVWIAAILVLGAPASAVLILQAVDIFHIFFTHANADLPPRLEKIVRLVLITPEMHRIHHSAEMLDQNANFGELFPWWDRLFGTYQDAPVAGYDRMRIGIQGCDAEQAARLSVLLAQPFGRAMDSGIEGSARALRVSGD